MKILLISDFMLNEDRLFGIIITALMALNGPLVIIIKVISE